MTMRALQAAARLEADHVDVAVLHVPTIKPLDREAILNATRGGRLVVTCENHTVVGGLAESVAATLAISPARSTRNWSRSCDGSRVRRRVRASIGAPACEHLLRLGGVEHDVREPDRDGFALLAAGHTGSHRRRCRFGGEPNPAGCPRAKSRRGGGPHRRPGSSSIGLRRGPGTARQRDIRRSGRQAVRRDERAGSRIGRTTIPPEPILPAAPPRHPGQAPLRISPGGEGRARPTAGWPPAGGTVTGG
jgi:hypothetical protein